MVGDKESISVGVSLIATDGEIDFSNVGKDETSIAGLSLDEIVGMSDSTEDGI